MYFRFNSAKGSKQCSEISEWAQSKWWEIQGYVIKTHFIFIKVVMYLYC